MTTRWSKYESLELRLDSCGRATIRSTNPVYYPFRLRPRPTWVLHPPVYASFAQGVVAAALLFVAFVTPVQAVWEDLRSLGGYFCAGSQHLTASALLQGEHSVYILGTPPKTHIDPENHWLVEENNLPGYHCPGLC